MADFPRPEFENRLARAQKLMREKKISAILLTTEPEIRYFTGFRTLFWLSPTRPWFVIVPQEGLPIAIIPEIGLNLMRTGWVEDIRCWPAPTPSDDGVSLLKDALRAYEKIAIMTGHETHLRMPLADFHDLQRELSAEWVDATAIIRGLRMVKSEAEIRYIADICALASQSFEALPSLAGQALQDGGLSLSDLFRRFKIDLLERGADDVPYLVGGAGNPSYGDVISPPGQTPLQAGDVVMVDTGAVLNGYYCDFDRNYSVGAPSASVEQAYETLWQATEAGLKGARPGMKACDLWRVMAEKIGSDSSDIGRLGHGLGMQLTEWPSLAAWDETVLSENMVLTLEPAINLAGGGMMVTEENIVITDGSARLLSIRAPGGIARLD